MRTQLYTVVVAVAVSTAVGFGIATATQPQVAEAGPAAKASASDSRVVQELRTLNRAVELLNRSVSGYTTSAPADSLRDTLKDICANTGAIDGAPHKYGC
jgi:hypothetical protein